MRYSYELLEFKNVKLQKFIATKQIPDILQGRKIQLRRLNFVFILRKKKQV